jgi:hypothetical protein
MSDHPNPGNRYEYINAEADMLHVNNPVNDARQFQKIEAHLSSLPPALTSEEAARNAKANGASSGPDTPPAPERVGTPSSTLSEYTEGGLFRVRVPQNWQELQGQNAVTFAPQGGYGTISGHSVFTHGVEIGVAQNGTRDLESATNALVESLTQSNPRLSRPSGFERTSIDGRDALHAELTNVSEATGREERVDVYTTLLQDGTLMYVFGVAPQSDFGHYKTVFSRVVSSIQLTR